MPSTPEYLEYVLGLLLDVPEVTRRKMMGEYVLYVSGKVFGGIYDDRFLVKRTGASGAVLHNVALPYEGGSMMLLVDTEDPDTIAAMVVSMASELPAPKKR